MRAGCMQLAVGCIEGAYQSPVPCVACWAAVTKGNSGGTSSQACFMST